MNNTDFRRLVESTPRSTTNNGTPNTFAKPSLPTSSLGSRKTSSIPMTPRTVKGGPSFTFAQQLAEHNNSAQPRRKFKSTATPKGVRYGESYTDRAAQRAAEEVQDEREKRVQALEEQMKLGQISVEMFEGLRDRITGGEVGATHLVKGLDRRLLERVRKGEDVLGEVKGTDQEGEEAAATTAEVNPEDELETLEQADVASIKRDDIKKKGEMAPPPKPVAGVKRSRADILAELKASRQAAEEAKSASQLGSRFKKFDPKRVEPRMERDDKGREVLITVDESGRIKRKVRAVALDDSKKQHLLLPEKGAKPLGIVVPHVLNPSTAEDDDGDIFAGAGDDYDPLGPALEDDDDDASVSEEDFSAAKQDKDAHNTRSPPAESVEPAPEAPDSAKTPKRNYFNERSPSPDAAVNSRANDPAILESIRRVAAHAEAAEKESQARPEQPEESSAAAKRLFQRDRDLDDIDMGFGASRYGDEEEDDGGKIKLSNWKGTGQEDDDDDGDSKEKGGQQRKRGKKKRKMGDKNSAADVLSVIEGRRK